MQPKKLKIYIGYDAREHVAYDVLRESILKRANLELKTQVLPLQLEHLPMLTRPIEKRDGKMWCPISQAPMATEFAISRFCVPFLTKGWALFMDCDMLVLDDISKLFALKDDKYAVMVVKHNQIAGPTSSTVKMDGQVQTYYNRKNWSSVVLWNCDHPANKGLTLEMLNSAPGRDLHAFSWLKDEEIGELPLEWNYLVGVSPEDQASKAKNLHYTLGGPWFKDWEPKPLDDVWKKEFLDLWPKFVD